MTGIGDAKHKGISPIVTEHHVVAPAAIQPVVAIPAVRPVVAPATEHCVVTIVATNITASILKSSVIQGLCSR